MKIARGRLWIVIFALGLLQGLFYLLQQQMQPEQGLIAKYYPTIDFSGKPRMATNDPEIAPWLVKRRARNLPPAGFSVEWTGFLRVEKAESVQFDVAKGGQLFLFGQELIDSRTGKQKPASVRLESGLLPILVRYSASGGPIRMELAWKKGDNGFETVPASSFQPGKDNYWYAMFRSLLTYWLRMFPYFWIAFASFRIAKRFGGRRSRLLFASLWIGFSLLCFFAWQRIPFSWFSMESWYGALLIYSCIGLLLSAICVFWHPRLPQTVLLLFSISLALVAAEVTLRILYPYQFLQKFEGVPSHFYHHLYRPNRNMFVGFSDQIPVTVRTNEDGLRTDYSRKEFLKHQNRIAILGDSFVFGYGVRQEARFSNSLETILRRKNPDVAVLNAGVISYSPFLENLLYRGIVKNYRPQLVILFLDVSDIGDDYRYMKEVKTDGRPHFDWADYHGAAYYGVLAELLRRNPFVWNALGFPVDLAQRAVNGPEPPKKEYDYYRFYLKIGNSIERNRYFIYRHPLEQTRSYFEATLQNIENARSAARESGAEFLLVLIPRFTHWNPKECPANWEKNAYKINEPYQFEIFRFFDEERSQVGFPIFNLLPAFQSTREFPLVLHGDPHWNERGHAFVARQLADYLTARH